MALTGQSSLLQILQSGPRVRHVGYACLVASCLALLLLASTCARPERLPAVPAGFTDQAVIAVGAVRYWADQDPKPLLAEVELRYERELLERERTSQTGPLLPEDFLAISGGGDNGAFAAGLLCGWTQAGDRPVFSYVTGVSTGALIAPFAFLGSEYDSVLREAFTTKSQKDIFEKRNIVSGLLRDAFRDSRPLAQMINHYITRNLLDEIAVEYMRGRLLLIGTTNLDARRGVIWNMGAIAASEDAQALELFRKIILASVSVPGLFPPVMIDVTVNGKKYQEMHVDGGATNQVFMYPEALRLNETVRDLEVDRERKIYVIRNSRLDGEWLNVDRRTLPIIGRAVSSLVENNGLGDLLRIYVTAVRDRIEYNLAFIPRDFDISNIEDYDPAYMTLLFERGFRSALSTYPWMKVPPGFAGPADANDRTTVQ